MPPRNSNLPRLRRGATSEPPSVMTKSKAAPIVIVAFAFDLVRGFFHLFWFFGPALAALYCTMHVSETLAGWTFGLLGTKTAAIACSSAATVIGAAAVEATAPIGVVMADAVGLIAFLSIGLWIVMTNIRILKAIKSAPLQFAGAFAVSEVPFIGAIPVFGIILCRLYGAQIRTDKVAYAKWEKETADARLQERNRQAQIQAYQSMQIQQAAQQAQFMRQEAANDERYNQQQAANDEIPEEEKLAA